MTQYGTSVACNWPRGNYDRAIERQNVSTPIFSVPHKPAICCICYYEAHLRNLVAKTGTHFIVCDFRGVDTLTMELLKSETENVSIYHIGDRPRYIPDRFKTKVSQWEFVGGFKTDLERDSAAIENCTHFLAIDFNSDEVRKSGTKRNIEKCLVLGKINIR